MGGDELIDIITPLGAGNRALSFIHLPSLTACLGFICRALQALLARASPNAGWLVRAYAAAGADPVGSAIGNVRLFIIRIAPISPRVTLHIAAYVLIWLLLSVSAAKQTQRRVEETQN